MRFKCVSKLWFSLILSRCFTNRHYRWHTVASTPRLYMSLVEHLECDSMEVCHNPGKSVLLSLSSSSGDSAESLDLDSTMPGIGGHYMVVLRGLMLYSVCKKACICNPATRQSITLPAVKSSIYSQEAYSKHVLYYFGHDPVLDQYKVVCNVVLHSEYFKRITSEHWVFVLEAGGSWKRIEFDQPHLPTRQGLCINGVIYYLASTSMSRSIVVSFDVRSEEFNTFRVPDSLSEFYKRTGFIEYGGKPALIDTSQLPLTGLADLWVLEDGGEWSKKSLVLQPSQRRLFDKNSFVVKVHGATQNGEVILAPIIWKPHIFYYDVEKNDLRKVRINTGNPDRGFRDSHVDYRHMEKSGSIMHLET